MSRSVPSKPAAPSCIRIPFSKHSGRNKCPESGSRLKVASLANAELDAVPPNLICPCCRLACAQLLPFLVSQRCDLGRFPILLPSLSSHSQANLLTCSVNMNLPSIFQLSLVFCCKTLQRMSQWQQVSLSHCLRRNHELALLLADSFRNLGCACPSSSLEARVHPRRWKHLRETC